MSYTHTYVTMGVSSSTYEEIAKILKDAGYDQAFMPNGVIDLHGLALKPPAQAVQGLHDLNAAQDACLRRAEPPYDHQAPIEIDEEAFLGRKDKTP